MGQSIWRRSSKGTAPLRIKDRKVLWESGDATSKAYADANRYRYKAEVYAPHIRMWMGDFDVYGFATPEEARSYAEKKHAETGRRYRVTDTGEVFP